MGEAQSQGKVPAGNRWIKSSLLGQKTWQKKRLKKNKKKSLFQQHSGSPAREKMWIHAPDVVRVIKTAGKGCIDNFF